MIDTEAPSTTPGTTDLIPGGLPRIERLSLANEETHVWQVDVESCRLPENFEAMLSEDERERMRRFRFSRDRRRFATCRVLLRVLLGSYLKVSPSELNFSYSAHGKPSLGVDYASSSIHFNLSHSGENAVFAFVRGREAGVDVEEVRHDFETQSVAERFFSPAEREALSQIPIENRHEAFFHCWTRKEAFVKAKGDGLSLPLDQFDVSLIPGQPAQLLGTRPDTEERHRWSMCSLDLGPEYAAALVVEGSVLKLVSYRLPGSVTKAGQP